jgi:hypothetical protein
MNSTRGTNKKFRSGFLLGVSLFRGDRFRDWSGKDNLLANRESGLGFRRDNYIEANVCSAGWRPAALGVLA